MNEQLPYLSTEDRLKAYQMIISGCTHIWSKGDMQTEKAMAALGTLIPLAKSDPLFLAKLNSYVATKMKTSKDLNVFVTFANSLNDGDGTPFSPGSKYKKPNLRIVSAAALHMMDVPLALRVLEVGKMRFGVKDILNEGEHISNTLKTAFKKYLKVREANPKQLEGIKKAGLSNKYSNIYRKLHLSPSDEVAIKLGWVQKDRPDLDYEDSLTKKFEKLSDAQIAEMIQKEKLPIQGVLGSLPRQISPVIAVALLEQATGNQAVILRTTFNDAGVLKDAEVMKLFEEKIKTAQTALDRVDKITTEVSEEVKRVLKETRSEVRKEEMAGLGKIFMHIDFSQSMQSAVEFAKERGAIIAECVNDPANNFRWGLFGSHGMELPLPESFEKEAFQHALFGRVANGSTNVFSLYPNAREFGAEVDVMITDQGHNFGGDLETLIQRYHENHPEHPKPRACVIVNYGVWDDTVKRAYEANGIPVAVLSPDALTESALVVQTVKEAMLGPSAVIDEIMATDLLELPKYYFTV